MSVTDWLSIDTIKGLEIFKGSLEVSIGTTVDATFGSSNSHTVGSHFDMVFDPLCMLIGGDPPAALTLLGKGLLAGMGSNASVVMGDDTTLRYQGLVTDVRRGPAIEKHTDHFMSTLSKVLFRKCRALPPDPVDQSAFQAIRVLSVLMVLTPAAFELALRAKYVENFNAGDADLDRLKSISNALTSRLAGIIRALEIMTFDAQVGVRLAEECTQGLADLRAWLAAKFSSSKAVSRECRRTDSQLVESLNFSLHAQAW